jgi:hypothetical protein
MGERAGIDGRSSRVRAYPPRLVHLMAGNSPIVAAMTIGWTALLTNTSTSSSRGVATPGRGVPSCVPRRGGRAGQVVGVRARLA